VGRLRRTIEIVTAGSEPRQQRIAGSKKDGKENKGMRVRGGTNWKKRSMLVSPKSSCDSIERSRDQGKSEHKTSEK